MAIRGRRATALAALAAVTCGFAAEALAGPGKVLVLPLDGDADPKIRTRYSASLQRLARVLDGKVASGDVTFTDTATAIGCDPQAPACAEDVRATLGVDELVYGAVTKRDGQLVVVVRRTAKGKPPREVSTTVSASDSPERAEPALLSLFHDGKSAAPAESPVTAPPGKAPAGPAAAPPDPASRTQAETATQPAEPSTTSARPPSRDRVLGIAAVAGGGTLLLISVALWASASGLQDDIDAHPVATRADFEALRELESSMSTRAWAGNAMFVGGLALGGLGGWLLFRDHKAKRAIVAPAPIAGGVGLSFTWLGGLP